MANDTNNTNRQRINTMSNLQRKTSACYGIECWLRSQGINVTTKTVSEITASFLKSKGLPYTKYNPKYKGLFNAGICNAQTVQEHFKDFKTFVLENYINTLIENKELIQ